MSICSDKEATAMLRDANGAVAVWGAMEQQVNGKERTMGFSRFSVTFIHRPSHISIAHFATLALSLVGKNTN